MTATRVAMALLAGQPLLLLLAPPLLGVPGPLPGVLLADLGGLGRGDRRQPGALGGLGLLLDPALLGQRGCLGLRPGPAGPRPRAASCRARSSASARARASSSRRASSAIRRRSSSAARAASASRICSALSGRTGSSRARIAAVISSGGSVPSTTR